VDEKKTVTWDLNLGFYDPDQGRLSSKEFKFEFM